MIRIQSLQKYFNKGKQNEIHVINNISMDLPETGMVAIFGPSGCGKTTLLNVIGGLDSFRSGSIEIGGEPIGRHTDDIRNAQIGYIFQNYNLSPQVTVFENVANALVLCGIKDKQILTQRVTAALKNVGMEHYAGRLPETLSGGQQQRVAIARALVKRPAIILADEPTGNLDEMNTVLVMDLLKQISKTCLVLLVTHEVDLINYYCDRIIELKDGQIVGERENAEANGYKARGKSDIFLGEYEKKTLEEAPISLDYYGDTPPAPVRMTLVNQNGKLYLKIGTPGIQILDDSSEVKLIEGTYQPEDETAQRQGTMHLEELPPVKGKHFGKLFSLRSSLTSGFARLYAGKQKRGNKLMRLCMTFFAAVLVLMTAFLSTGIRDWLSAKDATNPNLFYVYTPNAEVSKRLNDAVNDASSGIDSLRLKSYDWSGFNTDSVSFTVGLFDSASADIAPMTSYALVLNRENFAVQDMLLVAGKKTDLKKNDVVITTALAEDILDQATVSFLSTPTDLIGLSMERSFYYANTLGTVVGVVESSEKAVYCDPWLIIDLFLDGEATEITCFPNERIEAGKAQQLVRYDAAAKKENEITFAGKKLTVMEEVITYPESYEAFLAMKQFTPPTLETWVTEKIREAYPDLSEGTDEFQALKETVSNERYFEWLEEYLQYAKDYHQFIWEYYEEFEAWLDVVKGMTVTRYLIPMKQETSGSLLYSAEKYRDEHGNFPPLDQANRLCRPYDSLSADMDELYQNYREEFYSSLHNGYYDETCYLINPADYLRSLTYLSGENTEGKGRYWKQYYYTMVHSSDAAKTESYLLEHFEDVLPLAEAEEMAGIVTPTDVREAKLASQKEDIIENCVSLAVVLGILCVCMFFIMRSSTMGRVKEIGIYRAIGVKKKNLTFRFLVEAMVLASTSVLIGYAIASFFVRLTLDQTVLLATQVYYPWWLALGVFVLIYLICGIFGVLPVSLLLRKTPSQILAKYDI